MAILWPLATVLRGDLRCLGGITPSGFRVSASLLVFPWRRGKHCVYVSVGVPQIADLSAVFAELFRNVLAIREARVQVMRHGSYGFAAAFRHEIRRRVDRCVVPSTSVVPRFWPIRFSS